MATTGTISQVIGSTFDAQFPEDDLPEIYNALEIKGSHHGIDIQLVGEVQQHLGGGQVRAVALGTTDGLTRGMKVTDTGASVSVPVGEEVLGRVFNLLGQPVDKQGPVNNKKTRPIHQLPPKFVDLNPKTQILETGIKVVDLLCPFVRGGKIGGLVADHETAVASHRPVFQKIEQHARLRLAAVAGPRIVAQPAVRMVRTEADVVDARILSGEFAAHPVVQGAHVRFAEHAARHAGLVGDDEDVIAGLIEVADGVGDAIDPAEARAAADVAVVVVDDAVAVEERSRLAGARIVGHGRVPPSARTRCTASITSPTGMLPM